MIIWFHQDIQVSVIVQIRQFSLMDSLPFTYYASLKFPLRRHNRQLFCPVSRTGISHFTNHNIQIAIPIDISNSQVCP